MEAAQLALISGGPGLVVVEGAVTRVTFSNAENGFAIVRIGAEPRPVKGTFGRVAVGDSFRVEGREEKGKFGVDILASKIMPVAPQGADGVTTYLSTLPGIGEVLAKRIVARFGERAVERLIDDSAAVSKAVKGLTPGKAGKAAAIAKEKAEEREVLVFLYGLGLSPAYAARALKVWGAKAPAIIRANPYRLARDISGIGFALADTIARNLGISAEALERREAAVLHVLGEASGSGARYKAGDRDRSTGGGHCFLPRGQLGDIAAQMLTCSRAAIDEAVQALEGGRAIVLEERRAADDAVYLAGLHKAESYVATKVQELIRERRPAPPPAKAGGKAAKVGEILSDEQRAAVALVRSAGVVVITGGPGTGKCLGAGTPVLRFDGTVVPVEAVQPGDLLMGPDSRPRRVLSTNTGEGQLFQVTPTKGDPWVCNDVHVMTLVRSDTDEVRDIQLDEYLAMSPGAKWRQKGKLFRAGVEFTVTDDVALPLRPYHLGVLLGDGTLKRLQLGLSKPDREIAQVAHEIADQFGVRVTTYNDDTTSVMYRFTRSDLTGHARNPLGLALEQLGLLDTDSASKFIPAAYKTASRAARLHLLAGLLDTDGSLDENGCTYDWISASRRLAEDLAFVARSLGLAAYIREARKGCQTGAVGTYWRVSISGDTNEIPCRLPRKRAQPRRQIKDVRRTAFEALPIGGGRYYGFTLDGDGRFLLGDFTVTHNTTTMRSVIEEWEEAKRTVVLCAPTGRAAKRLGESTERGASTIHRLLAWQGDTGPQRNEQSPLVADLVVVDEASMLDIPLARCLVAAIPRGATLLLVGDVDQLPSVGAGQVLHDIIESGAVPVARLSRIFRQAAGSEISAAAAAVLRGAVPESGGELRVVPVPADADEPAGEIARREVVETVLRRLPAAGFQPRQVQVLTPMHKGAAGTQELNRALQAALNPHGAELRRGGDRPGFRVGDPVLQTKNDYDLGEAGIMNGDLGRVVAVDPSGPSMTACFDDEDVVIAKDALGNLELAYAMSIHKSQGGEFPAVVLVVLGEHYVMLRRNLLYTAITRGKRQVVIVGQHKALGIAARTPDTSTRNTGLRQRLAAGAAGQARDPIERAIEAAPDPIAAARAALHHITSAGPRRP